MSTQHFRSHFPIFQHRPNLVYLDSAATSLKPQTVIDRISDYYTNTSTNVGRGLYPLAEHTTEQFETIRGCIADFIGSKNAREIIFTSGTTASINLIAMLLAPRIQTTDTLVTTDLEHHSNFLPWKELARTTGAHLRIAPLASSGFLDIEALLARIDDTTKVVTFSALSNVLGSIEPVADIVKRIKEKNAHAIVIVDAAQAVAHIPLDVSLWDADFIAFSGHKMYGPTGIGVLYGKTSILETLRGVHFGGGMVLDACAQETEYKDSPYRFEAGTPDIAGVLGLGAAVDFIKSIGYDALRKHDTRIMIHTHTALQQVFGEKIHILGSVSPDMRAGIISFTLDGIHPHDLAQILGEHAICIRAGEHCAAPLHRSLSLPATARISFGLYTTEEDIDQLIDGMRVAQATLASRK